MYVVMVVIAGLAGVLEVSNEPVAVVVQYPEMQQIALTPEDVMIYSEAIPHVETITDTQVVFSQRSMAEMVAANVPEPPPESKPTLPNEGRNKKRLDHTPPFNGTVTGDVSIIESGANERIILVTNIQGDGVMQVLIKGDTAKTTAGVAAQPVLNSPKVLVRNTEAATNVEIGHSSALKTQGAIPAPQKASLESHFKGSLPPNLKILSEPLTVE